MGGLSFFSTMISTRRMAKHVSRRNQWSVLRIFQRRNWRMLNMRRGCSWTTPLRGGILMGTLPQRGRPSADLRFWRSYPSDLAPQATLKYVRGYWKFAHRHYMKPGQILFVTLGVTIRRQLLCRLWLKPRQHACHSAKVLTVWWLLLRR